MKKSIAFVRDFCRVLQKRETSALKARARNSRANRDWALEKNMATVYAEHVCTLIGPKTTFLDCRYSCITTIGSLTYSSTLCVEIHGRGVEEVVLKSRAGLVRYVQAISKRLRL